MIHPIQTLAFLGGLSQWDIILIFLAVLILFGPKSIPALARSLGQGVKEFKNASSKFSDALNNAAEEDEKKSADSKSSNKNNEIKELIESSMPEHDLEVKDSVATSPSGYKS
ncbi:MAG: twin-arginine translocase TatA/TatE family subunit [Sumerlaeia bacterium]